MRGWFTILLIVFTVCPIVPLASTAGYTEALASVGRGVWFNYTVSTIVRLDGLRDFAGKIGIAGDLVVAYVINDIDNEILLELYDPGSGVVRNYTIRYWDDFSGSLTLANNEVFLIPNATTLLRISIDGIVSYNISSKPGNLTGVWQGFYRDGKYYIVYSVKRMYMSYLGYYSINGGDIVFHKITSIHPSGVYGVYGDIITAYKTVYWLSSNTTTSTPYIIAYPLSNRYIVGFYDTSYTSVGVYDLEAGKEIGRITAGDIGLRSSAVLSIIVLGNNSFIVYGSKGFERINYYVTVDGDTGTINHIMLPEHGEVYSGPEGCIIYTSSSGSTIYIAKITKEGLDLGLRIELGLPDYLSDLTVKGKNIYMITYAPISGRSYLAILEYTGLIRTPYLKEIKTGISVGERIGDGYFVRLSANGTIYNPYGKTTYVKVYYYIYDNSTGKLVKSDYIDVVEYDSMFEGSGTAILGNGTYRVEYKVVTSFTIYSLDTPRALVIEAISVNKTYSTITIESPTTPQGNVSETTTTPCTTESTTTPWTTTSPTTTNGSLTMGTTTSPTGTTGSKATEGGLSTLLPLVIVAVIVVAVLAFIFARR